jgi:hypothetical protein
LPDNFFETLMIELNFKMRPFTTQKLTGLAVLSLEQIDIPLAV